MKIQNSKFPFNWLYELTLHLFLKLQDCSSKDSTEMICVLPPGVVPPAFINSDNFGNITASQTGDFLRFQGLYHSQRKKRAPMAKYSNSDNSTCEIYLGFILDALQTYLNTSKSLPFITLAFTATF